MARHLRNNDKQVISSTETMKLVSSPTITRYVNKQAIFGFGRIIDQLILIHLFGAFKLQMQKITP